LEAAVRKLLVASQKSGVGKTTASVNLAAAAARAGARVLLLDADPLSSISTALNLARHPRRRPLRDAGVELPGVLVSGVVPGLDIVSPYDDGCCADEDLDNVLKVLASPDFAERCGCLIVGAPPFLGANPAQLLAACDEYLIVMRAESTAPRMLPAFLELVQRNKSAARPIQLRGMLLTLPEPDEDGARWERELRGRFGSRVLANVVPYDEEIRKAQDAGQVALAAAPDSPAAQIYVQLCETLGLAAVAGADPRRECPLLEVAASMQAAGALTPRRATVAVSSAVGVEEAEALVTAPVFAEVMEAPPTRLPPPSKAKLPVPTPPSRAGLKPPTAPPSKARLPAPAAPSGVKNKPAPVEKKADVATPTPKPTRAAARRAGPPRIVWLGVAAAAVVGVGLRFVPKLPDVGMPVVVGVLVAAGMVLTLRLLSTQPNGARPSKPKKSQPNKAALSRQPEPYKDARARIAALARQSREQRYKRDA
jgi:chromosome partitioning protein